MNQSQISIKLIIPGYIQIKPFIINYLPTIKYMLRLSNYEISILFMLSKRNKAVLEYKKLEFGNFS